MDGKGIILHLREVEGGHAILDVRKLQEETETKIDINDGEYEFFYLRF